MDIWDSLRLVRRHWRFTLPVVVAGVLVSIVLYSVGSTTWKVQTSVMLLGPGQTVRVVDGQVITEDENPYFLAGEAMPLTRVLVHAMRDPAVLTTLSESGLSTNFKQEWDNRQPLVNTTVIADGPELATETAERLLVLTATELATRQTDVGAPEHEHAFQSELSFSDPKEDFKVPRLFFGVGLAVTILATVGAAFSLEWWRRRGEEELVDGSVGEYVTNDGRAVRVVPDEAAARASAPRREETTPDPGSRDDESGSRWGRRAAN